MAVDSDYDHIVTLEPRGDGEEQVPPETTPSPAREPLAAVPAAVPELPAYVPTVGAAEPAPFAPEAGAAIVEPARTRKRPAWVLPAAIAAVGLIASGTLGYFFYDTSNKLNATRHTLTTTQQNLEATTQQLTNTKQELSTAQERAAYVAVIVAGYGKVETDYGVIAQCDSYGSCLGDAQQMLSDAQAFQASRQSANAPSDFSSADSQLGDSLTALIAGLQQYISGMESYDLNKIKAGAKKVDNAMLSLGKAESALAAQLK
jgi:hypothetical protein